VGVDFFFFLERETNKNRKKEKKLDSLGFHCVGGWKEFSLTIYESGKYEFLPIQINFQSKCCFLDVSSQKFNKLMDGVVNLYIIYYF